MQRRCPERLPALSRQVRREQRLLCPQRGAGAIAASAAARGNVDARATAAAWKFSGRHLPHRGARRMQRVRPPTALCGAHFQPAHKESGERLAHYGSCQGLKSSSPSGGRGLLGVGGANWWRSELGSAAARVEGGSSPEVVPSPQRRRLLSAAVRSPPAPRLLSFARASILSEQVTGKVIEDLGGHGEGRMSSTAHGEGGGSQGWRFIKAPLGCESWRESFTFNPSQILKSSFPGFTYSLPGTVCSELERNVCP